MSDGMGSSEWANDLGQRLDASHVVESADVVVWGTEAVALLDSSRHMWEQTGQETDNKESI